MSIVAALFGLLWSADEIPTKAIERDSRDSDVAKEKCAPSVLDGVLARIAAAPDCYALGNELARLPSLPNADWRVAQSAVSQRLAELSAM